MKYFLYKKEKIPVVRFNAYITKDRYEKLMKICKEYNYTQTRLLTSLIDNYEKIIKY
jgi:hypothetical protein